jgi:hypothetical protein
MQWFDTFCVWVVACAYDNPPPQFSPLNFGQCTILLALLCLDAVFGRLEQERRARERYIYIYIYIHWKTLSIVKGPTDNV